jgi:hypothetical protein
VLATMKDGIRLRWRFDRLFPAWTLDLKSLGDWRGRDLRYAVGDAMAKGGMDMQRAFYDDGRRIMYEFIRNGQIFGAVTSREQAWLEQLPDLAPDFDFMWLFYQKPDAKGHAPVILPVLDDGPRREPHVDEPILSELHRAGKAKVANALALYRQCLARFGKDKPWSRVEPLHYADAQRYGPENPTIVLPSWITQVEPPTDEAAWNGEEEEA